MSLEDLTPQEYRLRYEALLEGARVRADRAVVTPMLIEPDSVIEHETVPGGWYHTTRLRRGEGLRLRNSQGSPGIAVIMWNAHDTSERLSVPDTLKVQWTARITTGHAILSDMGRVMASIVADDCGGHDAIAGGDAVAIVTEPGRRRTRDNFLRAAGKIGLDARDIPPCLTFFAPVQVKEDGRLQWVDGVLRAGQSVDLVAAMDLLVAVSTCPHPLAPAGEAGPVEVIRYRTRSGADERARKAGPEAIRAFENTDRG